jgi:uncharacterized membrane protein (DUF2068 family)
MDVNAPHLRFKDQNRRERTWTIHLIALEKITKGTILIIVALRMLTLLGQDVHEWAVNFVSRHGIDVGNRYAQAVLERLLGVSDKQLITWSTVALIYSTFLFIEGLGLWYQKRWAEYLTAAGTALLIPLELFEIYERFTPLRVAILVINVFIVWYLVTRLMDETRLRAEAVQEAIRGNA